MHTEERPLSVVIAALLHEGKILLIRRRRGDYVGLWGLPGGKVERGEHLAAASVREIAEESGIEAEFTEYRGIVSELLVENGRVARHFMLHVCELAPRTTAILNEAEGELGWFALGAIAEIRDRVIPSDFLIIEKMVRTTGKAYYECVLKKSGAAHTLKLFR
jgi:ADP-ribose pyrophosphatase YjhB (NUDIX family)